MRMSVSAMRVHVIRIAQGCQCGDGRLARPSRAQFGGCGQLEDFCRGSVARTLPLALCFLPHKENKKMKALVIPALLLLAASAVAQTAPAQTTPAQTPPDPTKH